LPVSTPSEDVGRPTCAPVPTSPLLFPKPEPLSNAMPDLAVGNNLGSSPNMTCCNDVNPSIPPPRYPPMVTKLCDGLMTTRPEVFPRSSVYERSSWLFE